MSVHLVVNADDFGLTRGVNRAIAELHDAGAVTSTTLMARGDAFKDAVTLAKQRPALGVGCHIVLTDGVPVCKPRLIPSLVGRDGVRFRPKLHSFLGALLTNQLDPLDVEREAVAQIRLLQDQGIEVTHLDTHKHTHLAPLILKPLLRAAVRTGVPAIRNPFEQPWAISQSSSGGARTSQLRLAQWMKSRFLQQPEIRSGQIRTTNGTIGVSATGALDEATLRDLVRALPEGTWELVCHPGYNDRDLDKVPTRLRSSRETERQALAAVLSTTVQSASSLSGAHLSAFNLIHYGSLS